MSDEEWALIADLVEPYSSRGKMGRPVKNDRRAVVDGIFYVAATGCQWRALPEKYPHWSTVHRYHLTWSRDGTWERICDRLRGLVREKEGREEAPSASIIDARSVRGAATVGAATRGYDAGKKVNGRKVFGVVDTLGLLVAVVTLVASGRFEVLPRRWVVERTWSWLMNNRRLQVDYERDPKVSEGFVWAAHSRLLMRRLTAEAHSEARWWNIRDSL